MSGPISFSGLWPSPGPTRSAATSGDSLATSASAVSSPTTTATEMAMQRSPAAP